MGISEWGFYINSQEKLKEVLALVEKHNKILKEQGIEKGQVGEELNAGSMIRQKISGRWRYYLCMSNGGGRDYTSAFIRNNYDGLVYHPFGKPDWWNSCQDYVWKKTEEEPLPTYPTKKN